MSGPVFGIIVGLLALAGAGAILLVLSSIYRTASCLTRLLVIGLAIGLLAKAGSAFTRPAAMDLGDFLIVAGVAAVFIRRLWVDRTGRMLDFWQ